ncbi:hypothetical protein CY34DRAFT_110090 [Suillus luteus UH-Slu-Lm8-n1]|uniref:Uncharacterized protein n=1 Tax=Suillus luteus UH-Slu-Lm8-n1 TaxID=930992 RepID=A0A0D0AL04_9AGAM|nr:hypothetical protein CY34DRAFT_110090 [Suillus luteus UH-Slu-Lm8-n1]
MPLRTHSTTPRFGGDYTQLVNFLESVERLAQPLGLSDKDIIKYALKYTAPNERELFQYYKGNNYEEFANSALFMYPECGIKRRYTRPTSAQSAIPLAPLEAPLEAPLTVTPQHPECALEQSAAAVEVPAHKTHEIIPLPPTPEAPIVKIALTPAYIEAPLLGEPTEPQSDPDHQVVEVVSPQLEIRDPTAIANAPEAPPEETAPREVRDDSKHLLHYSVPMEEPSAVSELQNAPHFNQKHVLGDPEAPPVHHMAPEVAQVARFEAFHPGAT